MLTRKKTIQNVFEAAGLIPFDPKAVDYNVLHKKNKKKRKMNRSRKQI